MTKEELKQEAEEKAKKRTKGFKCQDNCEKSYVMGALDFAEPREKRITELNKKLSEAETDFDKMFWQKNDLIQKEKDKLTKAKELLNEFMRIGKASDEDFEHDYTELIGEAEQFIKDIEVEK